MRFPERAPPHGTCRSIILFFDAYGGAVVGHDHGMSSADLSSGREPREAGLRWTRPTAGMKQNKGSVRRRIQPRHRPSAHPVAVGGAGQRKSLPDTCQRFVAPFFWEGRAAMRRRRCAVDACDDGWRCSDVGTSPSRGKRREFWNASCRRWAIGRRPGWEQKSETGEGEGQDPDFLRSLPQLLSLRFGRWGRCNPPLLALLVRALAKQKGHIHAWRVWASMSVGHMGTLPNFRCEMDVWMSISNESNRLCVRSTCS